MTNFRALLCAIGVMAVALPVVVGCAASSPPAPSDTPAPEPTAEHGSYAHCLAEHGVETAPAPALGPQPGPAAPPPGVDDATWQQATQSCLDLAPGPPRS